MHRTSQGDNPVVLHGEQAKEYIAIHGQPDIWQVSYPRGGWSLPHYPKCGGRSPQCKPKGIYQLYYHQKGWTWIDGEHTYICSEGKLHREKDMPEYTRLRHILKQETGCL
ncbi:MAG: hypothetical protein ACPH5P_00095 [Akkermansiaceae bacterium]